MVGKAYQPLQAVKVTSANASSGRRVTIPQHIWENLGIEVGDRLMPTEQDGLLVYVPLPDNND